MNLSCCMALGGVQEMAKLHPQKQETKNSGTDIF